MNALALTSLAWAPTRPQQVKIGGTFSPSTTLAWEMSEDSHLAGCVMYWRETTAPHWQYRKFVGKVDT